MTNQKTYPLNEHNEMYYGMKSKKEEILRKSFIDWKELSERNDKDPRVVRLNELDRMIDNSIKGNMSGILGQERAAASLRLCSDIVLLPNIQLPSDNPEYSQEHDFIAISRYGILSIEVKNISAPYARITEQGEIISKNNYGITRKKGDVALQSRRHFASIRGVLNGTRFEGVPVKNVILFSNNFCTVDNRFRFENGNKRIQDCYCNTVDEVIYQGREVLSDSDMQELKQIFVDASSRYAEKKYPLNVSEEEYLEAVQDIVDLKKSNDKMDKVGRIINGVMILPALIADLF